MEASSIVAMEIVRQAEFGMEPSWQDFTIAGKQAGWREVVGELIELEKEFGSDEVFGFVIRGKIRLWRGAE